MDLNEIKVALNSEGIYARTVTPEGSLEPELIQIDLDEDPLGRDQMMIIKFNAQTINLEEDIRFVRVAFSIDLPFSFNDLSISDTSRLINFINKHCDLPGFELDEVEQTIAYRHVHLGREETADIHYFTSTIGLILMYMDMHSDTIEKVASGSRSFESIINEIVADHQYI